MSFKQEALAYIQELPDDCTEADLDYFLYVRRSIQAGEDDVQVGRVVSQEQIEAMVERWLSD